jgi:phosphopantothenoylcysteine synthetase/decarboxylase
VTTGSRPSGRTLYVIVCGAGPAADVATLVVAAQQRGWVVCVATTPAGREFVDIAELEKLTGYPVRTEPRRPGDPESSWPLADAIVVAPATINTVCKWAAGIADLRAWGVQVLYERSAPPPTWMASWEQILTATESLRDR